METPICWGLYKPLAIRGNREARAEKPLSSCSSKYLDFWLDFEARNQGFGLVGSCSSDNELQSLSQGSGLGWQVSPPE